MHKKMVSKGKQKQECGSRSLTMKGGIAERGEKRAAKITGTRQQVNQRTQLLWLQRRMQTIALQS